MLITNGIVNRDINPAKLPEYISKGYKEVKPTRRNNSGQGNKPEEGNKPGQGNKPEEGNNE